MLYNKYAKKMQKARKVKNFIVKFRIAISIVLCLTLAFSLTFMFGKGAVVGEVSVPSTIEYGQEIKLKGSSALFGKVYYEYREINSDEWTTEMPSTPGTYVVRAVGSKNFKQKSYSDEVEFTIEEKITLVEIVSSEVVYGEAPQVRGYILDGHTIDTSKLKFKYDYDINSLTDSSINAKCEIDLDSIVVLDQNGLDITDCYKFQTNPVDIKVNTKAISLKPKDYTLEYTGSKVEIDVELADYKLENNDKVVDYTYKYYQNGIEVTPVNAGVYEIKLESVELVGDSVNSYMQILGSSTLTITKKTLEVTTPSVSKVFNATPLRSLDSVVNFSSDAKADEIKISGLCSNHSANFLSTSSILNVGTTSNKIEVTVGDINNNDVTSNYEIIYTYGELEITKASVIFELNDITKVYDGREYFEHNGYVIKNKDTNEEIANDSFPYNLSIYDDKLMLDTSVNSLNRVFVGEYETNFVISSISSNIEGLTDDMYSNYNVEIINPKLTISPRDLVITGTDITTTYSVANSVSNTIETIEVVGLQEDDEISQITFSSYINVGTYQDEILDITITNQLFEATTVDTIRPLNDNYNIIYEGCTITIEKLILNVTSDTFSKVYDKVDATGMYTIISKDNEGNDNSNELNLLLLYNKYSSSSLVDPVEGEAYLPNTGVIEPINPYLQNAGNVVFSVDGVTKEAINAGSYKGIIESLNSNLTLNTNNYEINFIEFDYEILKRDITISLGEVEDITYDGESHEFDSRNYVVLENTICEGDTIDVVLNYNDTTFAPLNSDTYIVTFVSHIENDSNENYNVICDNSSQIVINPKDVQLTLVNKEYIYGNLQDITNIEIEVSSDIGLVKEDKITVNNIKVFRLDGIEIEDVKDLHVGSYYIIPNEYEFSVGLSSNYNVHILELIGLDEELTSDNSKLDITRRTININLLDDVSKIYNGEVQSHDGTYTNLDEVNTSDEGLAYGEEISQMTIEYYDESDSLLSTTGIKDSGSYKVKVVSINDENDDYNVVSEFASFVINKREISIKPVAITHVYDNTSYTSNEFEYLEGSLHLVNGEEIIVTIKYYLDNTEIEAIEVNTYESRITNIEYVSANENNYIINYDTTSTLEIIKRTVKIDLLDYEKVYDGLNNVEFGLRYNVIEVDGINYFDILSGHEITINVLFDEEALQPKDVKIPSSGVSSYVVSFDSFNGENYNHNYNIICYNTSLFTITPKEIELSLKDQTFTYGDITHSTYDEVDRELNDASKEQFIKGEGCTVNSVIILDSNGLVPSKLNVGTYNLTFSVDALTYFENTISTNYTITPLYSTLQINKLQITPRLDLSLINVTEIDGKYVHEYDSSEVRYQESDNNFIIDITLPYSDVLVLHFDIYDLINNSGPYDFAINSSKYNLTYNNTYMANGDYIEDNYEIDSTNLSLEFEITPKEAHITINDLNKTYDSSNYTSSSVNVISNDFISTDVIDNYLFKFKLNDVIFDEVKDSYTYEVVLDSYNCNSIYYSQSNEYKNYNIIIDNPSFTISKKDVTIAPHGFIGTYNGKYQTYNDIYDYYDNYYYEGSYDYYVFGELNGKIKVSVNYYDSGYNQIDSVIHAGDYYTKIASHETTEELINYNILYSENYTSFIINQLQITITLKDYSKTYDKVSIDPSKIEFEENEYMYDILVLTDIIYNNDETFDPINVGKYSINVKEYTITNSLLSDDSKGDYNITFIESNLTINKREISVSLDPIEDKEYDGKNISYTDSYSNFIINEGSLGICDGDELKVNVGILDLIDETNGTKKSVKDSSRYQLVCQYDNKGDCYTSTDGLKNYIVTVTNDRKVEFEITPRQVTLTVTNDLDKIYDNCSIGYKDVKYNLSNVVKDEIITPTISFSNGQMMIFNAGTYYVTCNQYMYNGDYVTNTSENPYRNYNIVVEEDENNYYEIVISKRKVTIKPVDREVTYNTSFAYLGKEEYQVVEGSFHSETAFKGITKFLYELDGVTYENPYNAGVYTSKIIEYEFEYIGDNENYEITLLPGTFTINRYKVYISLMTNVKNEYTGNENPFPREVNKAFITNNIGDYIPFTIDVYYDGSDVIPTEIGKYNVTFKGDIEDGGLDNYEVICTDTVTYEITKQKIWIKPTLQTPTYNGEVQGLTGETWEYHTDMHLPEDVTIQVTFKYYNDISCNFEVTEVKDRGTYYVKIDSVTFEDPSYEDTYEIEYDYSEAIRKFEINPYAVEIEEIVIEDHIYDGQVYKHDTFDYTLKEGYSFFNGDSPELNIYYWQYITNGLEYIIDPIACGQYRAEISFFNNPNYAIKNYQYIDFNITQRTVEVSFDQEKLNSLNQEYGTQTNLPDNFYTLGNVVEGEVLDVRFYFESKDLNAGPGIILDVATYQIGIDRYYLNDNYSKYYSALFNAEDGSFSLKEGNYNFVIVGDREFTITQKEVIVTVTNDVLESLKTYDALDDLKDSYQLDSVFKAYYNNSEYLSKMTFNTPSGLNGDVISNIVVRYIKEDNTSIFYDNTKVLDAATYTPVVVSYTVTNGYSQYNYNKYGQGNYSFKFVYEENNEECIYNILPRPIAFSFKNESSNGYDGRDKTIITQINNNSLKVSGFNYNLSITYNGEEVSKVRDAGTYIIDLGEWSIDNIEYNPNYSVGWMSLTLVIEKRIITIDLLDLSHIYNGKAYEATGLIGETYNLSTYSNNIIAGDTVTINVIYDNDETLKPIDVKINELNRIDGYSISFKDHTENDDKNNYQIVVTNDGNAKLTIYPKEIIVKLEDQAFTYGDLTLENMGSKTEVRFSDETTPLCGDDTIAVSGFNIVTSNLSSVTKFNAGEYYITPKEVIFEGGKETNYKFIYTLSDLSDKGKESGKVIIEKKDITLNLKSETEEFNGENSHSKEFEITPNILGNGLIEGDILSEQISVKGVSYYNSNNIAVSGMLDAGSYKAIGQYESSNYNVIDATSKSDSYNYEITKAKIDTNPNAEGLTKFFDGTQIDLEGFSTNLSNFDITGETFNQDLEGFELLLEKFNNVTQKWEKVTEAKDVGKYRVKVSDCINENFEIENSIYSEFEIKETIIKVTLTLPDDTNYIYNGNNQIDELDCNIEFTSLNGYEFDSSIIDLDRLVYKVTYNGKVSEFKDAKTYKVTLYEDSIRDLDGNKLNENIDFEIDEIDVTMSPITLYGYIREEWRSSSYDVSISNINGKLEITSDSNCSLILVDKKDSEHVTVLYGESLLVSVNYPSVVSNNDNYIIELLEAGEFDKLPFKIKIDGLSTDGGVFGSGSGGSDLLEGYFEEMGSAKHPGDTGEVKPEVVFVKDGEIYSEAIDAGNYDIVFKDDPLYDFISVDENGEPLMGGNGEPLLDGNGNQIVDDNGNPLTSKDKVTESQYRITKDTIKIKVNNISKYYDGTPLYGSDATWRYADEDQRYELELLFEKSLTNAGQIKNTPTIISVKLNGRVVNSNNIILETSGTITVKQRKLRIETSNISKVFDGEYLEHDHYYSYVEQGLDGYDLLPGHRLFVNKETAFQTILKGSCKNLVKFKVYDQYGNDVTKNYDSDHKGAGTLKVTKVSFTMEVILGEYRETLITDSDIDLSDYKFTYSYNAEKDRYYLEKVIQISTGKNVTEGFKLTT